LEGAQIKAGKDGNCWGESEDRCEKRGYERWGGLKDSNGKREKIKRASGSQKVAKKGESRRSVVTGREAVRTNPQGNLSSAGGFDKRGRKQGRQVLMMDQS